MLTESRNNTEYIGPQSTLKIETRKAKFEKKYCLKKLRCTLAVHALEALHALARVAVDAIDACAVVQARVRVAVVDVS